MTAATLTWRVSDVSDEGVLPRGPGEHDLACCPSCRGRRSIAGQDILITCAIKTITQPSALLSSTQMESFAF